MITVIQNKHSAKALRQKKLTVLREEQKSPEQGQEWHEMEMELCGYVILWLMSNIYVVFILLPTLNSKNPSNFLNGKRNIYVIQNKPLSTSPEFVLGSNFWRSPGWLQYGDWLPGELTIWFEGCNFRRRKDLEIDLNHQWPKKASTKAPCPLGVHMHKRCQVHLFHLALLSCTLL